MPRASIDRFGRVLVPKRLRERLGLDAGTQVDLQIDGDMLVLRPLPPEPTLGHEGAVLVAHVEADEDLGALLPQLRSRR